MIVNAVQIPFRIVFLRHAHTLEAGCRLSRLSLRVMSCSRSTSCSSSTTSLSVTQGSATSSRASTRMRTTRSTQHARSSHRSLESRATAVLCRRRFFFIMSLSLCRLPRLLRIGQLPAALDSLTMRIQQRFSRPVATLSRTYLVRPIQLLLVLLLFAAHVVAVTVLGEEVSGKRARTAAVADINFTKCRT